MKKTLLNWTNRLYMLIFCVTLFYMGTQWERGNPVLILYESYLLFLVVPLFVYWILLLIGKRIANHPQYPTSYCVAAVATLAVSGFFWGFMIYYHLQGAVGFERRIDYFGWPGFVFLCSLLIAVFYVICAVITRREQKEAAALPKTE